MPDNVTLDPPITNIERLLAKAAGMEDVSVDEPETRIERYLKAICDRLDSGGTGGDIFVVTFSYDESTETWSADKTFAECVAAWEAGKNLFSFDGGNYYPMTSVTTESDEVTYIAFYIADAETQTIVGYGINAEGACYYGGE